MRFAVVLALSLLVGCSPETEEVADASERFDASVDLLDAGSFDAGPTDAGASFDAGMPDAGQPDGTPTRRACTNTFGAGLSTAHGRIDGVLVAIVPPSARSCHADSDHLHLQVAAGGAVYDVAVNTTADVRYLARDGSQLGPDFSEGWHPWLKLGYRKLALRSGDFVKLTPSQLVQQLQAELANVNHISVFGNGYSESGLHNVHYQEGYSYDGAIITRPLSGNARQLFFRFENDVF